MLTPRALKPGRVRWLRGLLLWAVPHQPQMGSHLPFPRNYTVSLSHWVASFALYQTNSTRQIQKRRQGKPQSQQHMGHFARDILQHQRLRGASKTQREANRECPAPPWASQCDEGGEWLPKGTRNHVRPPASSLPELRSLFCPGQPHAPPLASGDSRRQAFRSGQAA